MRVSGLLTSGVFVSATLGLLVGCGGGGDAPSFQNREPISLETKQSQATTDKYAADAERYNAEREKALIAAGVRKPEDEVKPLAGAPKTTEVAKLSTTPVVASKSVVDVPESEIQKQCKVGNYYTAPGTANICDQFRALTTEPAKTPPSISEFQDLHKHCGTAVAQADPDVAQRCKQNADLIQMMTPG